MTASASSGFDTAQISKTESFSGLNLSANDPATAYFTLFSSNQQPSYSAASSQAASASTQFNFRGQTASASTMINGPSLISTAASASSAEPPISILRATAGASFNDVLTFSANGYQQETVLVIMKYNISGAGTTSGDGNQTYGSSSLGISLGGGYANQSGYVQPGYTNGYLSSGYQYSPYKIFAVTLGSQQNFNISLSATCQMNSVLGGGACSDSATFRYGGIAGLSQLNGTEITNYSVKSLSGYDYVNAVAPVPEPETYAMMLAGLCLIGGIAKRRGVRQV